MSRASKQPENTAAGLRCNGLPQKELSCTGLKNPFNPENSYLIFFPLQAEIHNRSSENCVVLCTTLLGLCKILRHSGLTRAVSHVFTTHSTPIYTSLFMEGPSVSQVYLFTSQILQVSLLCVNLSFNLMQKQYFPHLNAKDYCLLLFGPVFPSCVNH